MSFRATITSEGGAGPRAITISIARGSLLQQDLAAVQRALCGESSAEREPAP